MQKGQPKDEACHASRNNCHRSYFTGTDNDTGALLPHFVASHDKLIRFVCVCVSLRAIEIRLDIACSAGIGERSINRAANWQLSMVTLLICR